MIEELDKRIDEGKDQVGDFIVYVDPEEVKYMMSEFVEEYGLALSSSSDNRIKEAYGELLRLFGLEGEYK